MKKLIILGVLLGLATQVPAQRFGENNPYHSTWTVAFGLTQPLFLDGANVAVTYFTNNFTFEYSHGMSLNLSGASLNDKNVESIYLPYSTGFGVGYRLTKYLDIRAEAKAHRYEVQLNSDEKTNYNNLDLGLGAYYRIYPFKNQKNWMSGMLIEPSIRFWTPVKSTLPGQEYSHISNDGIERIHKPYSMGLFGNISLGYTFKSNKK